MTRPIWSGRSAHQKARLRRKEIVQLPLGSSSSRRLWRVSQATAADLVRPRGRKRSNCRRAIRAEFSRWGQAAPVYRPGLPGPDSRRRPELHPRRPRVCLAEARDAAHAEMPLRAVRATPGIQMPRMKAYVIQPAGGRPSYDLGECEKSIELSASAGRLPDEIHEANYTSRKLHN